MKVDLLGYAASFAVLTTFLMRTMVPLRLIAILSNILFLLYGLIAHIYPIFFLHITLLPINTFRLFAIRRRQDSQLMSRSFATEVDSTPHALWFAVGILAGGLLALALLKRLAWL